MSIPDRTESKVRAGTRRKRVFVAITVIGAALVTYYCCEAVYRFGKYRQLIEADFKFNAVSEDPILKFNGNTGFSYIANTKTQYRKFSRNDGQLLIDHTLHVNNAGHVSKRDVVVEKPDSEFRIAVLGDSFTAALEMDEPWPDRLQTLLNEDVELKESLGCSAFRVMNFGQDGIGFIQFDSIHAHAVTPHNPDLVIVNFITDDLMRRFVYRDTLRRTLDGFSYDIELHSYSLPCDLSNAECFLGPVSVADDVFANPEKQTRLKRDIARLRIEQISWFSPYPELIASRIGRSRLFHSSDVARVHGDIQSTFLSVIAICHHIRNTSKSALFLWMPISVAEMQTTPRIVQRIVESVPGIRLTPMSNYLPRDVDAFQSMFVPDDGHLNDAGGAVYAAAVYRRLQREFMKR